KVAQSRYLSSQPDHRKNRRRPWMVLSRRQHAKRRAKREVGHDIKRGEIQHAHHINPLLRLGLNLLVQLPHQQIKVLHKQRLLLPQRLIAEGVGKDASKPRMIRVVGREHAEYAIRLWDIELWVFG